MPHLIIDSENFEYSHPAFVADLTTQLAADRPHHLRVRQLARLDMQSAQFRVREFARLFALGTQPADQPLRHDRPDGRRNKKWLYAEVDQTRNRRGRIIGM